MAQVKFFRRENATAVSSTDLSNMSNDGVYLISTGSNKSYIFYGKQCVGGSWKVDEPLLTSGTGAAYTITLPYAHTFVEGDCIRVQFHTTSTSMTPTLNSVPVRRRMSSSASFTTGSSINWLTTGITYNLVYSKLGTTYYWVVEGVARPVAADLYGQLPSSILEISSTDIGTGATLTSGKLYVVYS